MHQITDIELPLVAFSHQEKCFHCDFTQLSHPEIEKKIAIYFQCYPNSYYRSDKKKFYFADDTTVIFGGYHDNMPDFMALDIAVQKKYEEYLQKEKIPYFKQNNVCYANYGLIDDNYHAFVYCEVSNAYGEPLISIRTRACFWGDYQELVIDVTSKYKKKKYSFPTTHQLDGKTVALFSYERKINAKSTMLFSSRNIKKSHPLNKAILYAHLKKWFSIHYKKVNLTSKGLFYIDDKVQLTHLSKKTQHPYLSKHPLSKSVNKTNMMDHINDFEIIACPHVNVSHFVVKKRGVQHDKKEYVHILPRSIDYAMTTDIDKPIVLLTREKDFYNDSTDPYKIIKSKYKYAQSVVVEKKDCLDIMLPIGMREAKINFEIHTKKFLPYLNDKQEEHLLDIYWRLGLEYYTAIYIVNFESYIFDITNGIPSFTTIDMSNISKYMQHHQKPIVIYEEKTDVVTPIKNLWLKFNNVYELMDTNIPVLMYDHDSVYTGQSVNMPLAGCLNHQYFYGIEHDYGNKHTLTRVKMLNVPLLNPQLESAIVQSMLCPWLVNYMPSKGGLEFRSLPSPFAYLRRFYRMLSC